MKMLSLFSGIGGLDLAAHWAGIETAAFCEIDPFCRSILAKHWPDVPIFEDVKKLTKEVLESAGIGAMNNDELAKFIHNAIGQKCDFCYNDKEWEGNICIGDCESGCLNWLESEAE